MFRVIHVVGRTEPTSPLLLSRSLSTSSTCSLSSSFFPPFGRFCLCLSTMGLYISFFFYLQAFFFFFCFALEKNVFRYAKCVVHSTWRRCQSGRRRHRFHLLDYSGPGSLFIRRRVEPRPGIKSYTNEYTEEKATRMTTDDRDHR